MRVLGRTRLSISRDESTSIERQREAISSWAELNGHTVVGWAEDSDVSGSVDPFDAPQLGDWLNNRANEFDVIAAWKLDRISRNAIKLNKLFGWCLDHDKTVVSCSESIDLGTPVGRLIANVIAFLAEGELEAIRERTISSRRKLRETARWAGGRPPYGYRAAKNGDGFRLEIDREAHAVVRRIVDAVLDEVPLARIAADLNRDGVLAPAEHYRKSVGKPVTGSSRWVPSAIRRMLMAPTLVGYSHLGGVTVRDDHGQPIRMAEPLVSEDERELIRAELARTEKGRYQRLETAPLSGLVFCWFCEAALSSSVSKGNNGNRYRYYRCHTNKCCYVPAETAEEEVERMLMDTLGDEQVTERVWVPGSSNEAELRAAVAAFDELSVTAGVATSRTAKDRLQRQLTALDARIAELEAMPAREGRYQDRPTGDTYREELEKTAGDPEARRALLKKVGVEIRIGVIDGRLLIHPVGLGDRLPLPEWARVDKNSSPEEIQRWQEGAAAERRKWGVPDAD